MKTKLRTCIDCSYTFLSRIDQCPKCGEETYPAIELFHGFWPAVYQFITNKRYRKKQRVLVPNTLKRIYDHLEIIQAKISDAQEDIEQMKMILRCIKETV